MRSPYSQHLDHDHSHDHNHDHSHDHSEEKSINLKLWLSFSVTLLLVLDFARLYLSFSIAQGYVFSNFSLGILVAQLGCLIVFSKGKICPGQRSRLINVCQPLNIFWFGWILISVFTTYRYYPMALVAMCGLGINMAIKAQTNTKNKANNSQNILKPALWVGLIGLVVNALILITYSGTLLTVFNPFAQIAMGILELYALLLLARNRLEKFMALLPALILINLLLSSLLSLFSLAFIDFQFNPLPWAVYFGVHLGLSFVIFLKQWQKQTFSAFLVSLLCLISLTLPLWAIFAFVI